MRKANEDLHPDTERRKSRLLLWRAMLGPMSISNSISKDSIKSKAREILAEYTRPWKVFTLLVGIALLILGSFFYGAPDWDIPISFIMAIFAYLTAPWSMRVLLERKWRLWPVMLFFTWFTVDGCYAIYWHFKNPVVLELMRSVNFPASLSLYGMCGIVWLYRGTLRQLASEIQNRFPLLRGNRTLKRAESLYRENHDA